MADIDIGRALSGLGAAFKNEMPAFIQQTRQEDALALQQSEFERKRLLQDEALAEKRRKTMFQDAAAASSLLDSGDYRGIADLMEDRITILGPTGADTSHSNEKRTLALRASVGDQRAIGELKRLIANEVGIGYSTGMIARPVERKGITVGRNIIDPVTGKVIYEGDPEDESFEQESELRKEFNALQTVKDFSIISGGLGKVLTSAKDPSGAGDISLLFAYMKMLDPNSVVREGEFATAQNAGSVPESLLARYNKVINGELLSSQIRNDFVDRAQRLYGNAAEQFGRTYKKYENIASQQGLDPRLALIDYRYDPTSSKILNIPQSALDQGVTADVWNLMTDEEQALFN
jgi:hypothetical protein